MQPRYFVTKSITSIIEDYKSTLLNKDIALQTKLRLITIFTFCNLIFS